MIFLTVGTQLPFDRLVRAVDKWCITTNSPNIFGQIAEGDPINYQPKNFKSSAYIDPQAFKNKFEQADLIISHAGMGSIITALTLAKPIVIMPRRASFGEHRNNHQLATAKQFSSRSGIFVAQDENELPSILDKLCENLASAEKGQANQFANPDLIGALRKFILS